MTKIIFHDGSPFHIETSQVMCRANQLTGFYMTGTSAMKELKATIKFESNVSKVGDLFFTRYS